MLGLSVMCKLVYLWNDALMKLSWEESYFLANFALDLLCDKADVHCAEARYRADFPVCRLSCVAVSCQAALETLMKPCKGVPHSLTMLHCQGALLHGSLVQLYCHLFTRAIDSTIATKLVVQIGTTCHNYRLWHEMLHRGQRVKVSRGHSQELVLYQ